MVVNINVVFGSAEAPGIGQLSSRLYRGDSVIATGSVYASGTITFNDAMSRDVIEINGLGTGTALVTVDVPTTGTIPNPYPAGTIFGTLIIN